MGVCGGKWSLETCEFQHDRRNRHMQRYKTVSDLVHRQCGLCVRRDDKSFDLYVAKLSA